MLLLYAILFILLLVGYYVVSILVQHARLQDYRNIPGLPISSIPFVGNLHQLGRRPEVFYQLLQRMYKKCQEQNKDLFVLWYSVWPIVFLCSGEGLKV